jgi:hypothetical protein
VCQYILYDSFNFLLSLGADQLELRLLSVGLDCCVVVDAMMKVGDPLQWCLSGSCTLGTESHRLWPNNLDTTSSLQWQTTMELSTPYQILLLVTQLRHAWAPSSRVRRLLVLRKHRRSWVIRKRQHLMPGMTRHSSRHPHASDRKALEFLHEGFSQHYVKYPAPGASTPWKGTTLHSTTMGWGSACQDALFPRLTTPYHRMVHVAG